MTTVYNAYYAANQDLTLNINNVDFNVKLVTDSYVPNPDDTPEIVTPYVINALSTFVGNDITTKTMSDLIDKAKARMETAFRLFPDVIRWEVNRVVGDQEKAEKIVQIMTMNSEPQKLWSDLREYGFQFVAEYPELGILCFSEPISY